jgi:HipA-like protein
MSEIFRTAYVYVRKIPEGWLLGAVSRNWKIDTKDRFGLLLVACKDAIGNVSVRGEKNVCNGRFLSD